MIAACIVASLVFSRTTYQPWMIILMAGEQLLRLASAAARGGPQGRRAASSRPFYPG